MMAQHFPFQLVDDVDDFHFAVLIFDFVNFRLHLLVVNRFEVVSVFNFVV